MSKFTVCSQAENWFYTHESDGVTNYLRIAVWAIDHNGEVVGLTSVTNESGYLSITPPLSGRYVHWSDMTMEQRMQAAPNDQFE